MAAGNTVSPRNRAKFSEAMIGLACALSAITALLFIPSILSSAPGSRDYIVYWATAQQLVHHANPYDAHAMSMLEHAWGQTKPGAFYMRNPPWALPLVLPLGLVSAKAGALPWSLYLLAVTLLGVSVVAPVLRPPGKYVAWIGYFSPLAINAIVAGQSPLFSLLGLALFLRLHRSRPFAAGAGLALCMVKPHLLIVCVPVFLVWIVLRRAWSLLLGILAAMAVSCAVTEWIDPAAWRQYVEWAHSSGIASEKISCLSVALRDLINPRADWLTYVPAAAACAWGLSYFWKRRREWDWRNHGGLLVIVSLLAAPYCFPWDQCLAIPALLFAAARTRSRAAMGMIALSYILINVQQMCGVLVRSPLWLWPAPFWLAWFLWARASDVRNHAPATESAALLSAS